MIEIYTDGGNSSKHKLGGCSAVICDGDLILQELAEGFENNPTNNQMELSGAIMGLTYLLDNPALGKDVTVISDSEYLVRGASNWLDGWKRKNWKGVAGPVKNQVLWEAIDFLRSELNITWKWVKGHGTNVRNNLADELAVKAYTKLIK